VLCSVVKEARKKCRGKHETRRLSFLKCFTTEQSKGDVSFGSNVSKFRSKSLKASIKPSARALFSERALYGNFITCTNTLTTGAKKKIGRKIGYHHYSFRFYYTIFAGGPPNLNGIKYFDLLSFHNHLLE